MSRPHDGHRQQFPFGNPLRALFPKESYLPPRLRALLNSFEESLAERFKKLQLKDKSDFLSLSWMSLAMELLCETHTDVKRLIADLEFPVSDWDEKWMDVYLDNSVRLLDMCIAFNSELSRLSQGQLLLQCVLHVLDVSSSPPSSEKLKKSRACLDDWLQHMTSRNPKLENCSVILSALAASLHLPKIKNSTRGKVLMHAMHGVKVQTLFVCSVFAAVFSGSAGKLVDLHPSDKHLWADSFSGLRADVNEEILKTCAYRRSTKILKELEAVDSCVKVLCPLIGNDCNSIDVENLKASATDLAKNMDNLSQGLDLLSKRVEGFFQIVLSGRDALLCNLRVYDSSSNSRKEKSIEGQFSR
ncbi:hypothetical protein Syun_013232 [Stephania yunnanensis]|uniref:Uncharacterized protein n=1 Tax=Stephania yunnanensis TaxID=152371 RepID=A0AAP0K0Y0_9MAGN